ncbi:MAG: cation diffusion facilitator family transporter [Deltaproteobacteria bacterium]|nr:cation diffusion facilitator family transporter [Deltaproteobacteria bacterium]MDH3382686.1 cation diffusion facilitator family transporter [Deltaproteobacteria bacterium]
MTHGLRKDELDRKRIQTARFSMGSAATLAVTKLFVGIASGSLGVLSSAFDNLADILMSGVNYLSIKKSMEPADFSHPYGHGKAETLGTVFMSVVVALTGVWIVREGIHRLRAGIVPRSVDVGLVVMALSVAASWYISERIRKAGEETGSSALKADSLHYRTDVYSSGGILVSLLAYRVTGWKWLDPGVAMVVGGYIVFAAFPIFREALGDLMDRSLPPETVEEIRRIIESHKPLVVDYHRLRTRRSGSEKHVDFHVVVCRQFLLQDAHRVADHLEMEVSQALGNAHVVTHMDPCDIECPGKEECERILTEIRKLEVPGEKRVTHP